MGDSDDKAIPANDSTATGSTTSSDLNEALSELKKDIASIAKIDWKDGGKDTGDNG